jgi:ferritin-like metal-binding protein YciE
MTTARERLIEWLRDAYATEEQAQTLLKRTAAQIEAPGPFTEILERQGARSSDHAARLKDCLTALGESPSMVKTITGQIVATAQTVSGYLVDDEPVKAALALSTFAHLEVMSYQILSIAAEVVGEDEIASTCRSLEADKAEFSDWLDNQVPDITEDYLLRQGVA